MLIAEVSVLEDGIFQKRKKRQVQEKERDRRREQNKNRDRKPGFGSGGDDGGNKGKSGLGFSSGSGFGENNTFNRAAAKALKESFVPQVYQLRQLQQHQHQQLQQQQQRPFNHQQTDFLLRLLQKQENANAKEMVMTTILWHKKLLRLKSRKERCKRNQKRYYLIW